ncbi:MAG: hypothetical protein MZV65_37795 [Chromatiales bacterium]|nr:hypothetical protein [Chromatiales bacterium]
MAATNTEKAICGSVSLAAFDVECRWILQTRPRLLRLRGLRTYDPRIKPQTVKQLAAFKQSQKDWLKKRDACGSDAACLERAMGERILEMDREIANYAYDNRNYDLRHMGENYDKPYGQRRW